MNRQDVKNAKEQAKGMLSRSAKVNIGPGLFRPTRNRSAPLVSSNYVELLEDIKGRIRHAQMQALSAANQELLLLYYSIGLDLHLRARRGTWGTAVIDRLALDLHREFPDLHGFSPRNLRRMRAFYRAYPLSAVEVRNRPRAVAKLPWAHNVIPDGCGNRGRTDPSPEGKKEMNRQGSPRFPRPLWERVGVRGSCELPAVGCQPSSFRTHRSAFITQRCPKLTVFTLCVQSFALGEQVIARLK